MIVAGVIALVAACIPPPADGPAPIPPPPTFPEPPTAGPAKAVGTPEASTRPTELGWCAGIRGNGPRFFTHFGSLSRATESYGFPSCVAGGSSGSITSFFVESIWAGGYVTDCDGIECPPGEQRARGALLLKSVTALSEVGALADVFSVIDILGRLFSDFFGTVSDPGVADSFNTSMMRLQGDLDDIVNPEFSALLGQPITAPIFFADVVGALGRAFSFEVENSTVFVRPGLLSFDAIARLLGRAAGFYSAYGTFFDDARMRDWLVACAEPTVGLTWTQTGSVPGSGAATCRDEFLAIYGDYRTDYRDAGPIYTRLDDPIGTYLPTITTTGVLVGDAVQQWYDARRAYESLQPVVFEPSFDDVRFGYWGQPDDLAVIDAQLQVDFPDDIVTTRFLPLGPQPWREVLTASPAEPGLAAAQRLATGGLSVGGWPDPLRIQVLDALGATATVAINRLGGIGSFTQSAASTLGASPEEVAAQFSLDPPFDSSFARSLEVASGVWCSDWDAPALLDFEGLFADGYQGTLITDDPYFTGVADPYAGIDPDAQIPGCTPGLALDAP